MASLESSLPKLLAGAWAGEKDGDPVEEHWTDELDGLMQGMMRWHKGGYLHLSELMEIVAGDPTQLRVRHFRTGLHAIEDEAIVFLLEQATNERAVWRLDGSDPVQRMVYQRSGEGIAVHFECDSGLPLVKGTFRYQMKSCTQ
ncbi:MAG: DUF6265 family protein [Fimbriimonadaceae bacterium]